MTSFIRIGDLAANEWHLLPITGLRQQIHADRNRASPRSGRTDQGVRDGFRPGQPFHTKIPAVEVWAAAGGGFVTDWQLPDGPRPGSRFRLNREDLDDGDGEDEDSENAAEEDAGEKDNWRHTPGRFTNLRRPRPHSMPVQRG